MSGGNHKDWAHEGRVVTLEVQTTGTTEQVWLAWSEPRRLAQWLVDDANGASYVGERLKWHFADFDLAVEYEVVEAIPDRRLVLRAPADGGLTRMLEVDIEPMDGKAFMKLSESGYDESEAGDDMYQSVVSGWKIAAATMRLYVERFYGLQKQSRLFVRQTAADYQKIWEYFTDPDKVGTWIGEMTQVGEARPYRLRLESGGELTGRFLAVTGREVLLGADQIDGTLELKAFPQPDGRALGIRVLSWRLGEEELAELSSAMLSALNRLSQELGDG